ncbi:trypsin-like peptidase domain-containing protein [Streptomyces sp. NPDC088387]|uniref:S1C family serine protease n=1 Tax=Streptomyces sp. NPDC088387 TaxID=3365859 RepID=UPI0037F175EE
MDEGKPTQGPDGHPDTTVAPLPGEAPVAGAGAPGDGPDRDSDANANANANAEGDFELRHPAPAPGSVPAQGGEAVAQDGDFVLERPVETAPSGRTAPADGQSASAGSADGRSASAGPKPLHDPDPYSTPPYGEPGPWAPAPPVRHPAEGATVAPPAPPQPVTPFAPPSAPAPAQASPPEAPSEPAPAQAGPYEAPPAPAHAGPYEAPPAPTPPAPAPQPAETPASADPWHRYDPWAAPAGATGTPGHLQQTGAGVPSEEQRRRRGRKALIGGALVLALVSGGVGGAVGVHLERNGGVTDVELPQAGKESEERPPDSVAGIAARALPSVVTLHVVGSDEEGTGTGFVLDGTGHILTNNHVVEPAGSDGEITVTFNSGDTAKAEVVGRDSGYDLAVVKVAGVKGLRPAPLGNSENVQVGDPVVAIGAPFDLAGTVTSGIISATERPITAGGDSGDGSDISYVDALQTDAPINPGNSGGPLLDAVGRVIGINSAIRSAGSGSEPDGGQAGSIGLGFAIPINQGKRVAEELINTGRATHPVIGITLDMNYTGDGARVGRESRDGGPAVTAGGPGDEAGIESGDVITEVDGRRVHSGEELIVKTRSHRPGDRLELTLERDGKERTVSLVLGSSDGD